MKKLFTTDDMLNLRGCYSKEQLTACSFMVKKEITIEEILKSEISLKDKRWFLYNQCGLPLEIKHKFALKSARLVAPFYNLKYPNDKRIEKCIEAIADFKENKITRSELLSARADAADAADAAAADAYDDATAAADATDDATAAADAAYAAAYAADAAYAAYAATAYAATAATAAATAATAAYDATAATATDYAAAAAYDAADYAAADYAAAAAYDAATAATDATDAADYAADYAAATAYDAATATADAAYAAAPIEKGFINLMLEMVELCE